MIQTLVICDQCRADIGVSIFKITMISEAWNNDLDFCHSNCLTAWVKARQKEMGEGCD